MTAGQSPEINEVRRCLPGFEPAFQALLTSEGPDLGAFEVMSEFARWVLAMESEGNDDVVQRSADVVELLLTAELGFPLGHDLGVEFVEAVGSPRSWMRAKTMAVAALQ
jgi:hypothetical protein